MQLHDAIAYHFGSFPFRFGNTQMTASIDFSLLVFGLANQCQNANQ